MTTSTMDAFVAAYHAGQRTIAVDLDDVLSQTNLMVCQMHNEIYQSDMTINDFQHYLYWQNRGWGNPDETFTKVRHLYASGLMERTEPIPNTIPHLLRLKELGFNLVLVTARSESQREGTEIWLNKHYPGVFKEMHFTGAFTHLDSLPANGEVKKVIEQVVARKKRSKADVAHAISAILLIDDSIENALDCATAHPPVPVLLFGAYPWNRHVSTQSTPEDMLAHSERVARGIDSEEAERLGVELEMGWTGESEGMKLPDGVKRVNGWKEVVEFVEGVVGSREGGVEMTR